MNYYKLLGLNDFASVSEVRKAYRKLSIKFHPDQNDGDQYFERMFLEIGEANAILSDPNKKILYDAQLRSETRTNNDFQSKGKQTDRKEEKATKDKESSNVDKSFYQKLVNNIKSIYFLLFGIIPLCLLLIFDEDIRNDFFNTKGQDDNDREEFITDYSIETPLLSEETAVYKEKEYFLPNRKIIRELEPIKFVMSDYNLTTSVEAIKILGKETVIQSDINLTLYYVYSGPMNSKGEEKYCSACKTSGGFVITNDQNMVIFADIELVVGTFSDTFVNKKSIKQSMQKYSKASHENTNSIVRDIAGNDSDNQISCNNINVLRKGGKTIAIVAIEGLPSRFYNPRSIDSYTEIDIKLPYCKELEQPIYNEEDVYASNLDENLQIDIIGFLQRVEFVSESNKYKLFTIGSEYLFNPRFKSFSYISI